MLGAMELLGYAAGIASEQEPRLPAIERGDVVDGFRHWRAPTRLQHRSVYERKAEHFCIP